MKRRKYLIQMLFLLLVLLSVSCGSDNRAASMHLVKTEGTVQVEDEKGKSVEAMENLGLYSGYGVVTKKESYGWINLDDTKLAKLDQESEVEVVKNDSQLELYVRSGSLFFNITQPLEENETLNIRTSTMAVGIRGTCGWVEVANEDLMCVYLLRGKVECSVLDEDGGILTTEIITAGQAAKMARDEEGVSITVAEFNLQGIPDFVKEELARDESLANLIQPEPAETAAPGQESDSQEETVLPENESAESLLAAYTGTYVPYPAYDSYSGGRSMTLDANGAVTGSETDGRLPTSIVQNGDGTIVIMFGEGERYMIYPAGAAIPDYWGREIDNTAVNIEYLYTSGGAMNIVYHADPASLGSFGEAAQTPPEGQQPEEAWAIETLPEDYVGEYTAVESNRYYPVILKENGVCDGWGDVGGAGAYNHYGSKPLSLTQNADGSIVIAFTYSTYTIFPVGLVPAEYEEDMQPDTVNLMYVYTTSFGPKTSWYYK